MKIFVCGLEEPTFVTNVVEYFIVLSFPPRDRSPVIPDSAFGLLCVPYNAERLASHGQALVE